MKSSKVLQEIGFICLHILPFIYLGIVYSSLPSQVPTHFNIHGEPDDYSSKFSLIWILLALNGIGYLLFLLIPKIDPKKFAETHVKIYRNIRIIITCMLVSISLLMVYMANGDALKGIMWLGIILAALCIFLGNYMQAVKHNYFIGIRTPWTLSSEDNWNKTHYVTGKLMFFGGILSLLILFIFPIEFSPLAPAIVLIAASLFGFIYSFVLFKQLKKEA